MADHQVTDLSRLYERASMKPTDQKPVSAPVFMPSSSPEDTYHRLSGIAGKVTGLTLHMGLALGEESLAILGSAEYSEVHVPAGSILICDVWSSYQAMADAGRNLRQALRQHDLHEPLPLPGDLIGCVIGSNPGRFNHGRSLYAQGLFWPERHVLSPELYLEAMQQSLPEDVPAPEGLVGHIAYAFKRSPRAVGAAVLLLEVWQDLADQQAFMARAFGPAMHHLGIPRPQTIPLVALGLKVQCSDYYYQPVSA